MDSNTTTPTNITIINDETISNTTNINKNTDISIEEEIYNIVVSYEPLIDSINIVERRAMKIIRLLSQECGDDVWTTYKWDAELSIK